MTFEKFFDEVWRLKKHTLFIFNEDDFDDVWEWADQEDCLWDDLKENPIVAINTHRTEMKASMFLKDDILNAEVVNFIITSGAVCVFIRKEQNNG